MGTACQGKGGPQRPSPVLLPETKDVLAQGEELGHEIVRDAVSVKNHTPASGTKVAGPRWASEWKQE